MADRVDAPVDPVKTACREPAPDRRTTQPDLVELHGADDAGLADRKRDHLEVRGELMSHTDA